MTFNFSRKGKKTNIRKENQKFRIQLLFDNRSLAAENENRQLDDLQQADFGRLPERLLLSVRIKSVNMKITPIVVFVIVIQRIFPS